MTGLRRIDNLQMVLEDVIVRQLDGDFIELGVWKGGLCILATSIFHAYKQYNRKVFLADSFDGIPAVNTSAYPADEAHVGTNNLEILSGKYTGGMQSVMNNFNLYFNVQSNRNLINSESFSQIETIQDPLESEFNVKIEFLKVI
jgi:O-methyltransferase